VETLELLEEMLADYPGTLLLVSHDRDFLDNVVTSTLVMEGDGRVGEYVGGYTDWIRQRPVAGGAAVTAKVAAATTATVAPAVPAPAKKKLSYKDARELEQLPIRIETLETRVGELTAQMNDPAFYQRDAAAMAAHTDLMAKTQAELDAAYERWNELEG
jgi:ATP-binding cassette subfamily F protein uup